MFLSVNAQFSPLVQVPSQLALVTEPSDGVSGQPIAPAVVVELRDASNHPVLQIGIAVTASIASGLGSVSGILTVPTDVQGKATFTDLVVTLPGNTAAVHTLSFETTINGQALPPALSQNFTVNPLGLPPMVVLVPQSVTDSAFQGGGNPAPDTVGVTNGGGGILSGLQAEIVYGSGQPNGWLGITMTPTRLVVQGATGSLVAGTYTAQVAVTATGAESDTLDVSFLIQPPTPVVELVAGPITVTPANPTETDPVSLSGTVTNAGNTAATNVAWQLKVDGAVVGSGTIPSVAAAGNATVSVAGLGPYPTGVHTTLLAVDPANLLTEPNEGDNTTSQGFTVSTTPVVELVAGPITVTPANPTETDPVSLSATLTNSGNMAAINVAWELKVAGVVLGNGTIASMAAAGSVTVSAGNLGPFGAGLHTAELAVDPANTVPESNEGDNTTSQGFTVGTFPLPDVIAQDLLGDPQLTEAQRIHLDSLGNHDGIFNLGDFLAYLQRSGLSASPEIMQRLLDAAVNITEKRK